jgi:hypothetical protein
MYRNKVRLSAASGSKSAGFDIFRVISDDDDLTPAQRGWRFVRVQGRYSAIS